MEPLLAIGEMLSSKGQYVICAFPEQFRDLAENAKLEFASLGTKYIELLESDAGKAAMGGGSSRFEKFRATIQLARNQTDANKELVRKQYEIVEREKPDRIVYNGKAVYPIIWGLKNKGKNILVCPLPYMHYVQGHTHVAFNNNFGPFNRLTYAIADFGLAVTVGISAGWMDLPKISRRRIRNALVSNKAMYTISPSLFSRPDHWDENLQVMGFHEREKSTSWRPDEDLAGYLRRHKDHQILFVTFGSMTNQMPAIINTAAGGLIKPRGYQSELIHFVSQIPYDWIFPKIYGVIHHGGSGTTHIALKHGCATLIVPHIIDQFVWNKIIADLGAGPEGIKIGKINAENLEPKILDLMNNNAYKKKAERIASQMEKEDFREDIYNFIVQD
jgi:UDP:flavonoid glycosyltransferase YjiC (YdhE family)